MTPLRLVACGLAAGAVGSLAQSIFFRLTERWAPKPPPGALARPDALATRVENESETLARRVVDDLMERGPLDDAEKARGGDLVQYAFGAGWGAVFGLAHGPRRAWRGPLGALAFGTLVWAIDDNILLPGFRLAGWPQRYPIKNHLYAIGAQWVYGFAVAGSFGLLAMPPGSPLLAEIGAHLATRPLPRPARPLARRVVRALLRAAPLARSLRLVAAAVRLARG